MKVIIAGSRGITDYGLVLRAVFESGFHPTEIVSGGARGADKLGEQYALGAKLPVRLFIPDWDGQGKAAGHIRNRLMGDYADALIALWDGESKGTKGMIQYMEKLNKPVHTLCYKI